MPYRSFLILPVLLLSGCTASFVVDPLVEAGKVRTPPTQPFRPVCQAGMRRNFAIALQRSASTGLH
jgi:hypothetical protein